MMRSGFVASVLGLLFGVSIAAAVLAATPPAHPVNPHLAGTITGFIDFTPRGTQPGLQYALRGSAECMTCHGNGESLENEASLPGASWSGSMMANATRDPLFWAALDVANQDGLEHGAEGIGDYCLRCHTPNGWYNGRVRKKQDVTGPIVDAADIVDGFNGCLLQGSHENSDASGNDYSGIGCQFCHRNLAEGPLGEPAFLENADIWLDDVECDSDGDGNGDGEPCRGATYSYPDDNPFGWEDFSPPHAWKKSDFHADSAMCGSCHDVTTPMLETGPFRTLVLDNGTNAGNDTGIPFPVERTFSEWRESDYGRLVFRDGAEDVAPVPGKYLVRGETCQDCHMRQAQPSTEMPDILACTFGPPRESNLAVHEFVGGNTWIPGILKAEFPGLGRDAAFDRTTAWANEMLAERSAQLQTTATLASGGTALNVGVTVTNLAGHKLPTGYGEGRRMWLAVEVLDAADTVVWSNGDWDAATGDLTVDAQTKIYEVKQGIWNTATGTCDTTDAQDREMFHFVLNNCVAKDNRIPPLGFTGAANPELASYAYSYPVEAPGSDRTVNFDRTNYTVPLPGGATGPFTVRATLQFQLASKEYIEFLRNEAVDNAFLDENTLCDGGPNRPFSTGPQDKSRGQYMYDLWASPQHGRSPPVAMASAEATVTP